MALRPLSSAGTLCLRLRSARKIPQQDRCKHEHRDDGKKPQGAGPRMPCPPRLNQMPRPAVALSAPCASAEGQTLDERSLSHERKIPNAVQKSTITRMPTTGNPG